MKWLLCMCLVLALIAPVAAEKIEVGLATPLTITGDVGIDGRLSLSVSPWENGPWLDTLSFQKPWATIGVSFPLGDTEPEARWGVGWDSGLMLYARVVAYGWSW